MMYCEYGQAIATLTLERIGIAMYKLNLAIRVSIKTCDQPLYQVMSACAAAILLPFAQIMVWSPLLYRRPWTP